jgi:hypothetical protein
MLHSHFSWPLDRVYRMLLALLQIAACGRLDLYQSYEVNQALARAKGQREVYFLVLFKLPLDVDRTAAAFRRVINAIPIEADPVLGLVIDSASPGNELLYANKSGCTVRVRFQYRMMMRENENSLKRHLSDSLL